MCQTSILFKADLKKKKKKLLMMKQVTFSRQVRFILEGGRNVTLYYVGVHWYPRRTSNFGSVGDFLSNTFKRLTKFLALKTLPKHHHCAFRLLSQWHFSDRQGDGTTVCDQQHLSL